MSEKHFIAARTRQTSDTFARTDARHLSTENAGQVVLRILVQHASTLPFQTSLRNRGQRELRTYGYEEGRGATEIAAMMRIMAASAHGLRNDMQLHVASLELKHAFGRVTPKLLHDAMVDQCNTGAALLRDDVGTGPSSKDGKRARPCSTR